MSTVITGLFESPADASAALHTLEARGVHRDCLSLVASESVPKESFGITTHSKLPEGVAIGAVGFLSRRVCEEMGIRQPVAAFEQLLAEPASNWHEAAIKAQYLIRRYSETADARDARRQRLIERVITRIFKGNRGSARLS